MDLNTVAEIKRSHSLESGIQWSDGDAWLAGGTWLFSEPQPAVRRLIDLEAFGWPALIVSEHGLEIAATCPIARLAQFESPAQGLGWAIYERMIFDEQGRVVNPTLRNYRIPALADIPRSEIYFAATEDKVGPLGAKSMSEAPFNPIAPALANGAYERDRDPVSSITIEARPHLPSDLPKAWTLQHLIG
jgi:hypothetical protein